MRSDEEKNRKKELAERIIALSQKRIVEDAPLLLEAVYAMEFAEKTEKGHISLEGRFFRYHVDQVITDFRNNKDGIARQLLHTLIHCLLGHPKERGFYQDKALFDVLADCKTAEFAECISRRLGSAWTWAIPGWLDCSRNSLAQQYHSVCQNNAMLRCLKDDTQKEVSVDNHALWNQKKSFPGEGEIGMIVVQGESDGEDAGTDWKIIMERICRKAKENGRWGSLAGELDFQGELAEENEISYAEFLKRFTVERERMQEDPDSIDFKWYHLGMEAYGNIPLLEPTECNDMPSNDHIVIALDTSGSCEGEVCGRFLRETMHLLRDMSKGRGKMDITLLQCDTEIQREMKITSSDQIETLMEDFCPCGFGGTDFRPVFAWVEEYREKGGEINALLYLTDGAGDYPQYEPSYPVAFLLLDAWCTEEIPSWILQLHLNVNDFTVKEA